MSWDTGHRQAMTGSGGHETTIVPRRAEIAPCWVSTGENPGRYLGIPANLTEPLPPPRELYQVALAMREGWNRNRVLELAVTLVVLGGIMLTFSRFVRWVEHRPGVVLPDPLLCLLAPRQLTWVIFALVYGGLLTGCSALLRRPQRLLLGLQSYGVMVLLRMLALWLAPLEPPLGMLPLEDPFVRVFGPNELLTKDLFFSGHTASLLVVYWAIPRGRTRSILLLSAAGVACCVLVQHVHYGIDVLAAPVFALAAVRAAGLVRGLLQLPPQHRD
jgi:hypothetical protein